eukprot:251361_1
MKFKAKLSLPHTQLLYNLVNPLSRLHSFSMNHSDTSMNVSSSNANNNNTANVMNNYNSSSNNNGTTTILYLDNDKLVLSTRGSSHKNDAEGIFCFAELITTDGIGIFNHHVIQSIETDNAILMEVCLVQLKTALRGVLGTQKDMDGRGTGGMANLFSQEVTMKLAKRNGGMPHICLDVRDVNVGEGGIGVHHAIPVRIMRVEELQYHVPPRLGMPDVQLTLPRHRDRPLKTVVERLKGIAPQVFLEGSMAGILTLRIDSDGASIRTAFNKLIPIHEDCKSSQTQSQSQGQSQSQSQSQEEGGSVSGSGSTSTSSTQFGSQSQTQTNNGNRNGNAPKRRRTQRCQTQNQTQNNNNSSQTQTRTQTQARSDEPVKCTVKLDTRKLHASLHWQATLGVRDVSSAVMCMWENEMLVLDVTLNPEIGRFMYYVPVHFVSSDELLS